MRNRMRESRTSGSVGGEGGNLLAYPAEILARAEIFHDAKAQPGLRKIAADYQNLADQLERRASDEP
jgi:hypothetical protein